MVAVAVEVESKPKKIPRRPIRDALDRRLEEWGSWIRGRYNLDRGYPTSSSLMWFQTAGPVGGDDDSEPFYGFPPPRVRLINGFILRLPNSEMDAVFVLYGAPRSLGEDELTTHAICKLCGVTASEESLERSCRRAKRYLEIVLAMNYMNTIPFASRLG